MNNIKHIMLYLMALLMACALILYTMYITDNINYVAVVMYICIILYALLINYIK